MKVLSSNKHNLFGRRVVTHDMESKINTDFSGLRDAVMDVVADAVSTEALVESFWRRIEVDSEDEDFLFIG